MSRQTIRRMYRRFIPHPWTGDKDLLVSYPKCGRSWLRLMLCDVLSYEYGLSISATEKITQHRALRERIKRNVVFTHEDLPMFKAPHEIELDKTYTNGKRVMLLVRDPRDVIISWYFQVTKRGSIKHFKHSIKTEHPSDFIYNEYGGLRTIIAYYNNWWSEKWVPREFRLQKYEDLQQDTFTNLQQVVRFFGWPDISDDAIKKAVDNNSFQRVKEREKHGKIDHDSFQATDSDSEAMKARKGEIGGYREYLSDAQIADLNKIINENLNPVFGYNY